ncbi:MAG: hypothetical protein HRU19_02010 [Pseudobacteriovorax sp.]|nr:hypothetical protein [Pseudobacteriovorax sp.]
MKQKYFGQTISGQTKSEEKVAGTVIFCVFFPILSFANFVLLGSLIGKNQPLSGAQLLVIFFSGIFLGTLFSWKLSRLVKIFIGYHRTINGFYYIEGHQDYLRLKRSRLISKTEGFESTNVVIPYYLFGGIKFISYNSKMHKANKKIRYESTYGFLEIYYSERIRDNPSKLLELFYWQKSNARKWARKKYYSYILDRVSSESPRLILGPGYWEKQTYAGLGQKIQQMSERI